MRNLVLMLILIAAAAAAATDGEAPVPAERSPGDLSVDERRQMMAAATLYNTCVYQEAMARNAANEDIRKVADLALGHCQPQLEELEHLISGWGFPSYFATGFARTVRDHAARNVLPELASVQGQ